MASTNKRSSEVDTAALQYLLDAFPSVPLELLASAFTRADSDSDLAAHFISLSLISPALHKQPSTLPVLSEATSSNAKQGSSLSQEETSVSPSNAKHGTRVSQVASGPHTSYARRLRANARSFTLEDYFPPSPEENAWMEPLKGRLDTETQGISPPPELQQADLLEEFPTLEKVKAKGKGEQMSVMPQPIKSMYRSTNKSSVASGLLSNGHSRSQDGLPRKRSSGVKDCPAKQEQIRQDDTLLWPTNTEAFLLSVLKDDSDLDIEAVRDVLGNFKGDLRKSLEVLLQMSTSSLSIDDALKSASEFGISEAKDPTLTKYGNATIQEYETYKAFEEAILKRKDSSMKFVVESLRNKYPQADTATLLEVLRATDFDYNNAEKILQEASLPEGPPSPRRTSSPCETARMILQSLFTGPEEEIKSEIKENGRRRKEKNSSTKPLKTRTDAFGQTESQDAILELRAVTRVDMEGSEDDSNKMQMPSYGSWDDYERHHASAKAHWKAMEFYLKAATTALADSNPEREELLTEKAKMYKELSMEAKDRANKYLLDITTSQHESGFTLDIQEQDLAGALQLVHLHLKLLSSIPSCRSFMVITGPKEGAKSNHKRIRKEVEGYLEEKGFDWVETVPFCLKICLKEG